MNGARFDTLARAVARASRRRLLATSLAAMAVAMAGPRRASAREGCSPDMVFCPAVASGSVPACTDLAGDPFNCGGCGIVCASRTCSAGSCVPCGNGQVECRTGAAPQCANLTTDPMNCGGCGYRCIWGECREGVCREGAGNPAGALTLGDPCGSDLECASVMLGGPGAIQQLVCRDTMTGSAQPRCCSVGGCEFDGDCCGALVCRQVYEGSVCVEKDSWSRSLGQRCDADEQCRISPSHMDPVCGMHGRGLGCCIGDGSPCSAEDADFCCDGLVCRNTGCEPFAPASPMAVLGAIRPSLGDGDLPQPVSRTFVPATSGYRDTEEARRLFALLGGCANAALSGKVDPETELFVSVHGFGSKPEADLALDFILRDLLFDQDVEFDFKQSDCTPGPPSWKRRGVAWLVGKPGRSTGTEAFIVLETAGPYVILVRTVGPAPADECVGFDLAMATAQSASGAILR